MKLPTCAEQYINLIVQKMRYRRKVRRDVQEELTAHFEDELKDCKNDEDKQKKAEQLIADFGDVDLLAILLRRAKIRCRPLWRTVIARTFQTVGVLILCFIFYMVWFLTGKPVVTTNYVTELNKFVRPAADETLNAAPLYDKAVELHKELSDDFLLFLAENKNAVIDDKDPQEMEELAEKIDKIFSDRTKKDFRQQRQDVQNQILNVFADLLGKKNNELTVEQKNIAKRWIQEKEEALELIVQGSQRPHYWRMYKSGHDNSDEMMGVLLPNLSDFRTLVRILALRASLRAEQGKYKEAFDDLMSCYRFGKHLKGDKFIVEQLVGIALEAVSVQTVRDIAGRYDIDSVLLKDLQRSLEQMVSDENFLISMETEKMAVYDEIQRCFTDGRLDGGHLYLARVKSISSNLQNDIGDMVLGTIFSPQQWLKVGKVLFAHPNKKQTRETAERYYDYWTKLYLKTPAQINADRIDPQKEASKIIEDNVFLQIFTPALARVNQIAYRNKTDVYATVTVLALLRYHKDKGSLPDDLQQLINTGYLKQLPDDAFSLKPLVYKKTLDDFILYSVGPDFIDNGGVSGKNKAGQDAPWREDGDTIFWPVAKPQVDK
ncbi:MAG: hypothetical protein JW837_15625 [Sedimentisphaerales bacterium]|nr:hypothetical protein [Sedimentisphaerales bacterium]